MAHLHVFCVINIFVQILNNLGCEITDLVINRLLRRISDCILFEKSDDYRQ